MKTLATHPELVRAWLLAIGGLPVSAPPAPPRALPPPAGHPLPGATAPTRH